MATLQNLIAKKFFDELMNSDEVDEEKGRPDQKVACAF